MRRKDKRNERRAYVPGRGFVEYATADVCRHQDWFPADPLATVRNNISKWDAYAQYLNYHEGQGGYARGSYNKKSWLLRVADDVASRARLYEKQLANCRKF